ncbi:MAG: FTR1 family protein [Gemmatimonadetes bacterium]|nr:FTR1 family protein [Gemmatimonadota bacterium]
MRLKLQLCTLAVFTAAGTAVAAPAPAQEPIGKRLSAIVGVAVEEYAKGVEESGRLKSAVEYDEATGFLREARDVAARLTTPNAVAVRTALDSLSAAAERRAGPTTVRAFYEEFSTALGAEGALDLPSRFVDLARGRSLYDANCASCHGITGQGGPPVPGGLEPPAIGRSDVMRDVSPALTYRIVSVGVQGTAMVGWSQTLSSDDRWDVVSYVNSLRTSDAERRRGNSVLARICPRCTDAPSPAQLFEWQTGHSDAQIAAMLRAGDPTTGLAASGPLTASEADALVAALHASSIVEPAARAQATSRAGMTDPRAAARNVLVMLEAAASAARAGRSAAAVDLALDAYIAFEPLETNARMRDPALVARMEREFADFRSALKRDDLSGAERILVVLEREVPTILELAVASSTSWGTFLESFLIILREGFEAILVLGAVVAFLIKTGHRKRVREIWYGSLAGVAASVVLAVLLRTVLAAVPASREVIEGVTLLVAVVVLFSVSYWLLSKVESAKWQQFIREKVNSALEHGGGLTLAFVAFLAVFREGAETALFFQALMSRSEASLVPVFAGIGAGGAALAVTFSLFYRFGVRIPLRPFFAVTSGLLYWMAFVFAGKGIKELQEGGAMTRTLLPGFPQIDSFGIYPTVETILLQVVLVALLLVALWRTFLIPAGPPGESRAVAAEPDEGAPQIPPEVAARLSELQVTAHRLQERVASLEKEVEHDATIHGERHAD